MKISKTVGLILACGLAAGASAQQRGVNMGPAMGTGAGGQHGGFGGDSPTIYSQPSQSPDGYFSDGVPGQYWSQRQADNFMLDNNYMVDGIRWWGSSENYTTPDLSNFSDFVIEFYNDAGGIPGSSIGAFTIPVGNANAVPTGLQNGLGGIEYKMESSIGIALQGGVPYWVSVGSVQIDPSLDGFAWSSNLTDGDGVAAFDFFDGGGYQSFFLGADGAFELMGAIPTPGAGATLGLAALLAARRRRA